MTDGWPGAVCAPSLSGGPSVISYLAEVISMINCRHTSLSLQECFWSKVDKRGTDDCWEWQGSINSRGYGTISVNSKTKRAHRVSWELTHGPIPEGLCVCHRCDNPICVNPSHLFLGTHTDNMRDMIQKGRDIHDVGPRGEKNGQCKLTKQDVHTIRCFLRAKYIQREIAEAYRVSRGTINAIATGRNWGWLKDEQGLNLNRAAKKAGLKKGPVLSTSDKTETEHNTRQEQDRGEHGLEKHW